MFAAFEDSWMKKLFDFPGVVIDMLRGLMPPEVVDACDFREMEQLSTQYVDDGLSQSFGDAAWRVRFRLAGAEGWLYLLLVLEFQSTVDSDMASRMHAYVGQLHRKLRRSGELPKGDRLPPVLPIVIYTGQRPWTAATELLVAPPGSFLEAYQPRQRFFLIDIHRLNAKDLPRRNLLSLRARFAQRDWATVGEDLRALAVDPETDANLADLFKELLRHEVMRSRDVAPEVKARFRELAKEGDLKDMGSFLDTALFESRQQGREEVRGEFLERQRAMLLRLAARKFGAGTAASLEALLTGIDDPRRLDEIGDRLIDSASGDELLSCVSESAERH